MLIGPRICVGGCAFRWQRAFLTAYEIISYREYIIIGPEQQQQQSAAHDKKNLFCFSGYSANAFTILTFAFNSILYIVRFGAYRRGKSLSGGWRMGERRDEKWIESSSI